MLDSWDVLIRGATVFDGSGRPPQVMDVAFAGRRVACVGRHLDQHRAHSVVDGTGRWLMPGFVDLSRTAAPRVDQLADRALPLGATTVVAQDDGVERPTYRGQPLATNVVTFVSHAKLRASVMGKDAPLERRPTAAQIDRMTARLEAALDEGYVGLSTSAEVAFTRVELRRLTEVLRRRGRTWHFIPDPQRPFETMRALLLTCGRAFRRTPLRILASATLDRVTRRTVAPVAKLLSWVLNGRHADGQITWWSDSAPLVVRSDKLRPGSTGLPELEALLSPAGAQLLRDPRFREKFVRAWGRGRRGLTLTRLLQWLQLAGPALTRKLVDLRIEKAPVAEWEGSHLLDVFGRLKAWQKAHVASRSAEERAAFAGAPDLRSLSKTEAEATFLLYLVGTMGPDLVWSSVIANRDERAVRRTALDEAFLPGPGAEAHGHLQGLALAAERGPDAVARQVRRLSREPAELLGLSGVGRLEAGYQADAVLLEPEKLKHHARDIERLESVDDRAAASVWVAGTQAWNGEHATEAVGLWALGRCLEVGTHPAPELRPVPRSAPARTVRKTAARIRTPSAVGAPPA